jgi:hypothetical protein
MVTIRQRHWVSGGKKKSAWLVSFADELGKRRQKTFKRKQDAVDWKFLDTSVTSASGPWFESATY